MEHYKPYTAHPLTTPPVQNPHSPAATGYKPTPVEIPGIIQQTNKLYQPYQPSKDSK